MLPKLIINGEDLSGLAAQDGIVQTDVARQARTVTTLDGVEYRTQITVRQIDVTLVQMPMARLLEIAKILTQPSEVTYVDRSLGQVTKTFWVEGFSHADHIVEAGVAYVDSVSFTLIER